MENLELSLTSLGAISRHIDKSHNELSKYLAKQIWSQQDRQCILECLAQLLLEKEYTLLISRHLRPLILDLLERNAERIKVDVRLNHDLHERLCVALSKLLNISPDAQAFAARYFSSSPPVFQRLFFTSEEAASIQYGPRRMKLRDLMGATLRFLQSDCEKFRVLWDWSACVSQLLTSDVMVRSYTAQCLALVSHMTDNQKTIFLRKVLSSEEILHLKMKSLEETQLLEVEKALVLANQGSAVWRKERVNKVTRGQVVTEDLTRSVTVVCGVILPRRTPRQDEQTSLNNLVLVDSTCQNLRRLAMAVASQKPILLEGPIGCGKTALVEYLAAVTGHIKAPDILKVQLGDQTDSKMLLGMYRCTDIPGKFVWQPGSLTQAVSKGSWILLEDIDHAPLDVISVLLPLMENKKLTIPGREDCIQMAPSFQFFATRRTFYSGGAWHRPQSSRAALLDKYWSKLQIGNMSREELKHVLMKRYPNLAVVVERLLDIYCQLTGDRHQISSSPQGPSAAQNISDEHITSLEGRSLSLRDLLKWCERIFLNFDNSCASTAQNVFLEALDCFTAMLSKSESRLKMAEIIGSKLNISREKAQHFCQMYLPAISVTELEVTVGRAMLLCKQSDAVGRQTFATTRPSSVLLEQLSVCVTKGEPVLLVGETGTGKTSTVQYLAEMTGHKLRVVNMNQQSDTADLLGGYKPVDQKLILLPLREAFEDLFSQTYSRKQNLTFLGHVQTCFRGKRWQDLLKLMDHVCKSALTKELHDKPNAALLQEQWEALALKLSQTQEQIRACESALVFAFVEGTLAQAVKKGQWILLDEINLAAAETLECLSGLLEGSAGSLVLLDRGDTEPLVRHPDFRLFACMNPATDVGKRNLPLGIRNRFTELYVEELESESDLRILVSDYLKGLNLTRGIIHGIISFYLAVRKEANTRLVDGTGHKPHYSLRTLCRALKYVASDPCYNIQRSLYEGFCLSFLTQLDRSSHPVVQKLVCQYILGGNVKCLKQPIPQPKDRVCMQIEGYWLIRGDMEPTLDSSYILTPSVKLNLKDLARVVSAGIHPVLIQGETSVGKTSLIKWLSAATGNQCVRINNHEHTDIQEYIGCYSSDEHGKLVFKEGVLIDAMRKGYWIILDELNLAPTDVLEALNRLLDDNRELFIAETQEVVKAHPRFMLFATQNPPGLYGGRKVLSRAFRNRFVELHFDELPSVELENILHQRCSLPPSYCSKLIKVMQNLQSLRRGSSVFAGKHGYITLRDLFRWAERYRLEEQNDTSRDWLQHLADDGYMLLAGRVRKPEEALTIQNILEKHFKRTVNSDALFSEAQVTSHPLILGILATPTTKFGHVVWTQGMRRLAVLVGRALRFGESVLLVGDTGCGKTTICQLFAALAGQKFFSVNCHLHMETSDFLGGLRPADAEDGRLFEWHDGPLVLAMKQDGVFLMDEISLADDSVLERLNSVLETEKSLVLAEKGSGDDEDVELIIAGKKFRLVATMNPGGDFGKKELSPALRNRFTEIWCPQSNSRNDLMQIVQHNLRPGLSLDQHDHQGKDIAELMLDFIDWLTNQEFGRRCILSVRDILSWVNFMNTPEWDLRLDTVTAFIHAACLVYVDGIGSGTTVSAAENALAARKSSMEYLEQRLSRITELDEEMQDALRVYNTSIPREPQWGEDFFGIDPFYIAAGPESEGRSLSDYALSAGTTAVNAQRILRALKLQRPILLEGSPGVGKTSLVAALAKASGNHLVRINLSEQTDVTDLFGTDLPVEGGKGGEFAWRDGPLLAGLKAGHWIVLDELNLASQSVLEGLNACFDHRAEIYIPELGMRFHVQHEKTKIFGCQNPFTQGGGRKGLPRSFLNRFTQVYVDALTNEDMQFIGDSIFPNIDNVIISKMVQFSNRLVQEVSVERKWGQIGGPWEFNLRDLFRWCQLMQTDQSPGFFNPGQHVGLVYADRMRTEADKAQVLAVFRKVFGEDFEPYMGSRQFHITPLNLQLGYSVLQRSGGAPIALDPPLSITHHSLRPLEALMKCVEMGWMVILVGPTASGKSSLVHLLALLTGHRLRVMAMNSAMDTTELLGGFEQVDIIRPWQQVLESMDYVVAMVTRRGLMSLDGAVQDTEFLLSTWSTFRRWLREEGLDTTEGMVTFEALNKLEVIIVLLHKLNTKLKVLTDMSKLQMDFTLLKERLAQMQDGWTHGGFEWLDGTLVQALQAGDWLLMDNVNFCSPSVLDRLNALLEPGGSLTINERGIIDGTTPTITPHPNFRLFLTMDPTHGEISRAMRNRGVEIYIPGEHEGVCSDTLDLKMVLHTLGVTGDCVCDLLISIHSEIKNTIWDSPASSMSSLLHAASLLSGQLQRGVDLPSALLQACGEAYAFCQRTTANQQLAQEVIERQLAVLDSEDWGSGLLCAGVWPDRIPSALLCTEDSCFSSVQRDGQVLLYCLNTLSLHGKRNRPLSLVDLQRAMQSGAVLDGLQFSGGGGLAGGAENALRLLPTAVKILTERASHSDWVLRTSWLSHLTKTYKHLEAGSTALKAVFSSKLIGKGKCLAELLQPHSTDDYRILVDMRWNKQYLDILANTCNFEDEERYMEFMEALNAVANRYNFKYIYQYLMKKLGSYVTNYIIKLGFIGRVDIGHLPHPVLVHLRSFFDLWDSFVLQAVQSGQPYISDHLMFEILQLLQWRDRFWHVCNTLSADTRSVCVMSLHWQWVHKNLILRLPQLLMGDSQQELHTISTAIQNALSSPVAVASALKGIQKTLGKPLPFKLEAVAECAARLRVLCRALDVRDLRLDNSLASLWKQEVSRLRGVAMGIDSKEALLEAWGLVLQANLLLEPQNSGELDTYILDTLWSGSVTSDPDRWLKWNPLNPEEHMNSRSLLGPSDTVCGPGMLSRAVWSRCMLGVLSSTDAGGRWDPSGSHFLSSSRLTLGEWRERIGQLQDLSAVIWDNMAMPELADFRLTDCRLQGLVLRRQLQSLSELLSPGLQESYAESCDSLTEGQDHISAAQEIQIALREGLPENLLPEGFLDTLVTCLTQFAHNRAQDSVQLARSGVFWVNMGLLQIQVWAPQTIFDPAVKRAYKLRYAQEELALLQEEWRGRSLSSQLLTGAELEESSTTDNFQHPRIRYLWVRMQQVKEQICELSRKQACRPPDPQYGRLYQELQHYLCSIGQPAAVGDLLSHLLKALQAPKSRLGIQGLLKEEAVWQASQHRFAQRLVEEYPLYPDVVVPLRAAILQVQHGMRLLASQVSSSVTAQPGLSRLVSTMLAFPSPAASSDLACADYLCSRECLHMLNGLGKQLPATEVSRLIPDHAVLLLNALLYIQSHTLSAGHLSAETRNLFRHVLCSNFWLFLKCALLYYVSQISMVIERILAFSLSSPLAKFLNGLEILLSKAQDWENNASRAVSLRNELEAITQLIIQWRKLELNCWSSSLDNAQKRHAENSTKHWLSIYQLIERYLQEQRTDSRHDDGVENLSLSSVTSTLQAFIEGSTLGEFSVRLSMLLGFHCHVLLAPKQEGHDSLCSLLWNLYKYYTQFSESIQAKITHLRSPIEKELKDFVKISKWNDVSFWSIKQSVEKTHRTLFKFVKKFEATLKDPCAPCLVEQGSSSSMDDVDSQPEETSLHRVHQALRATDGPEELSSDKEPSSLQARLPVLTRKMKKLCVQLVKKTTLPELSEDLDQFTGITIITNVQALQGLTVDRSMEQEKQKAEVKHILIQKQRALADLFKMLAQIGQSESFHPYFDSNNVHRLFAEMMDAWEGCEKYFYRSWARRNAMLTALQSSVKELGLGNIQRCKGFSSHLFKLLLKQRGRLAGLTEHWVQLGKLINSIQSIKSDTHCSEDDVSGLPPQKPLQHWITRAQSSVLHCSVVLQQLSWILQCCPEGSSAAPAEAREGEVMQGQATLSHPSPMPPHIQPQACLLRRGDLSSVLNPSLFRFKLYINISLLSPPHRDHFTLCCSSLDRLGLVVGQMPALEQLFIPDGVPVLRTQPALICGLQAVRTEVDTCLTEFTTWKTHLLSIRQSQKRRSDPFSAEFSRQLEKTINMVLCAVQTLVKRKEKEKAEDQQSESKRESDSEVAEELLKPGHLSRLLEEDLSGDVSSLSLPEVNGVVTELLERLGSHRDDCQPHQLQVSQACRGVVRLEPMLCLYSELVRYYLAVLMGAHRTTGKLLSVLANVFTELAQKGFCLPQELMGGGDGEGATEFHDYEGGGIGEGEGVKDVSDKIENEDQVEDTFQEGQDKKEEEQNKQDIKEEDNAIEMSEDFDGKMHDGENEEDSDKEEDEELDKKMGDLGDGQTDTLDERMWGDEEDDEDDVDSDKEEESGAGMDQGESELVAKDDNTDAGESNKDKNQDKDHLKEEEEKEKIHEQLDEREFDENEVDPYHGKQEKAGETEAMDLPDDLNLDEDGKDEEGGEGDGMFNIQASPLTEDILPFKTIGLLIFCNEGGDEMTDEQQEGQIEEQGEENETEEKEGAEKSENQESETDERGQNEEEEKEEEEKNKGQEEGRDENKSIPADQGQKPNEEENEGEDDEAQMESAERKEHASDGLTGEENVQSDTAVELAGAASERDQAKEEDGSGAADASQSEGHDSKLMARMSSHKQRQRNTQSFKRKPGQADNERSMGDYNERVNKRLRTVDNREEKTQDQSQPNTQQESDLYEHIKHGEERYDAQTYDAASAEQQKPTGVKQEEEDEEEDIAMDVEDEKDLQAVEAQELKPEKLNDNTASQKEMEKPETQRSSNEEEMKERSDESTIHTIVHQFVFCQAPLKNPEELRREMELQLEAWQRQTLGSQEEESAAAALWHQYQNLTSPLSQQLCEQLRLVLEPTQAAKLRGDFRTGKRLNMRKVIPYIASQFRKDKIWLRRTKPSKRNYQICLAVDDSSSMVDNHSKQLAFESVSVIVNALTLLEVGQVAVCSFGESVQLLHPFHQQFNDQTGAKILRLCQFQQKKTRIAQFLETSTNMFMAAKQQTPETSQLLLIVSDGRGLFLEGKERVAAAVQAARSANIFVIFVVLDNPNSRDSILDIKVPIFKGPGELPEIRSYMEEFPFPFYIILRNVNALPETLSDALRQWFELVTATDQ
uniref:Midasin n=1 Tax=Cyprinus carpio TaxID=7962 RepID=A0A8C1W377_CYPCA